MTSEQDDRFAKLRSRAFSAGAEKVGFASFHFSPSSAQPSDFAIELGRSGWHHSIYAKSVESLLDQFDIFLKERGW